MNPFFRIKAHLESNLFHQQRIISTSPKDTTGREMDTCPSRASPSSKKKRGVYEKKRTGKSIVSLSLLGESFRGTRENAGGGSQDLAGLSSQLSS